MHPCNRQFSAHAVLPHYLKAFFDLDGDAKNARKFGGNPSFCSKRRMADLHAFSRAAERSRGGRSFQICHGLGRLYPTDWDGYCRNSGGRCC